MIKKNYARAKRLHSFSIKRMKITNYEGKQHT